MRKYIILLLTVLISKFSFSQKQKVIATSDGNCNEAKWELAFEDNFDRRSLNTSIWANRGYAQGSFDNEGSEEYYTFDNIRLENGLCKITPKKETVVRKAVSWKADNLKLDDGKINTRTYNYTSGWMETTQKFHYGKYEIRCKIPKGKSFWPAFWMYGEVNGVNNEIDVFEFWNPQNMFGKYNPKKLSMIHHMTVHYNKKMTGKSYTGLDYSLDYHTFSVIWDSTKIEWYVDGVVKRVMTKYLTNNGKNVTCKDVKASRTYVLNPVFPEAPMVIIANIAIQIGKNRPDENTFKNADYEIDYIRYYRPLK